VEISFKGIERPLALFACVQDAKQRYAHGAMQRRVAREGGDDEFFGGQDWSITSTAAVKSVISFLTPSLSYSPSR
jgi:hypothetical protein